MAKVRVVATAELSDEERRAIRRLLDSAFAGDFSEDDWQHALGGSHALIASGGTLVAHGSVVERRLYVDDRPLRTGYVEAVAVAPALQRTGLGTTVMTALTDAVRATFELGALSTGEWRFYERLGWERWRGPTCVRLRDGRHMRSADDDDGVMVLRCASSRDVDLAGTIACEERTGDSW